MPLTFHLTDSERLAVKWVLADTAINTCHHGIAQERVKRQIWKLDSEGPCEVEAVGPGERFVFERFSAELDKVVAEAEFEFAHLPLVLEFIDAFIAANFIFIEDYEFYYMAPV